MSKVDIDLTKRKGHFRRGLLYRAVGSVQIDRVKGTMVDGDHVPTTNGKRLAFHTALSIGEIAGHVANDGEPDYGGGMDGLNEYIDALCDGFVLQDITYTPVKVESDGRIIIRVEGEITDF
jgi:hypothetical protein